MEHSLCYQQPTTQQTTAVQHHGELPCVSLVRARNISLFISTDTALLSLCMNVCKPVIISSSSKFPSENIIFI